MNLTWKEFADLVYQEGHDAIVIMNEYDVVEGVRRAGPLHPISPTISNYSADTGED